MNVNRQKQKLRHKYVWQDKEWPNFTWNSDVLLPLLSKARKAQGQILAQAGSLNLKEQARLLSDEAFTTSAIEGEKLDRDSIRSSAARRLGLPSAGLSLQQRAIDGLVEMLLDATQNWQKPLTKERLCGWQAALFPTGYSGIHKIEVGRWREGDEPMRVVSRSGKHEVIHFEAPPSAVLVSEMTAFLNWWKYSEDKLDGFIRAGIAHFYFVTLHPFDDGNGRVGRAVTDMALAQDEKIGARFYSLSSQIIKNRDEYYDRLERSQKGSCDITEWLTWFLDLLIKAIDESSGFILKTLNIAEFWQKNSQLDLNERQRKVLLRLLDAEPDGFKGGMTNRKYVGLTRASRETAKRDLADLEQKGLIQRNPGRGRSVSYALVKP